MGDLVNILGAAPRHPVVYPISRVNLL